jgi:hypothetical protein
MGASPFCNRRNVAKRQSTLRHTPHKRALSHHPTKVMAEHIHARHQYLRQAPRIAQQQCFWHERRVLGCTSTQQEAVVHLALVCPCSHVARLDSKCCCCGQFAVVARLVHVQTLCLHGKRTGLALRQGLHALVVGVASEEQADRIMRCAQMKCSRPQDTEAHIHPDMFI